MLSLDAISIADIVDPMHYSAVCSAEVGTSSVPQQHECKEP